MSTLTYPRLTSFHQELDTSPACFGTLRSSLDCLNDAPALRARMQEDGYLYLPGYLDREEVMAARQVMTDRLAAQGYLDPAYPTIEAVAKADANVSFKPDLAEHNAPLMQLLYSGRMMAFYEHFLGGAVRHFDFTWIRAVAPGNGTPPHCDIVYMGRGTQNLYTAWTPLGDVDLDQGGLMVLEKSHLNERLRANYGSKDVDVYCTNRRGEGYTDMGGGGNISRGGWLSRTPAKLRERLGGRWLTVPKYRAGDLLTFSVYLVHASLDNHSNHIRLSSDTRYQLASEPVDERWIGENPIGHGPAGKRGMIC
ncbi:MAG: phytanoyl-CoA dioxygenase family protein [Abitibacteriaceae bacterium]|nr:phytanoyl-CoA dioxygenase family protein [Abditibacteriaceae bacterium]